MILFSNQFPCCSCCANKERTEGFWGVASGRVKRKMINSLCGSLGSAKTENSCSKLPPTSSNESVSEFKNSLPLHPPPALPSELERSSLTPPSLSFPNMKFEADAEIEVQSPDTSMWDSFFSEHLDSDFMMTSPLTPSYSYNYICAQGQTLTGCSPPRSSSAVGALSSSHKWKGLSPLHKVFTSPNNEFNVQRGSPNLPAIGELLGDFEGDGFETFATAAKLSEMNVFDHMSSSLPEALNALALPNSSSFSGSSSEQSAPCSSLYVNDGNEYRMGLAQKSLQQDQNEQQINPPQLHSTTSSKLPENEGQIFRHSLTVPVSTASELEHDSGLQLVHLLLACAEAMAKEDYMLARRYLQHLSGVVSHLGDSMQRVAACFTTALSDRLAATLISPKPIAPNPTFPSFPPNSLEILRVYQIVYQACPYIKFAHFTANQAIFEAFEGEERVHVIDLDILQGYQWPAFMQALAARSNNPPFLRITGVDQDIESVRETGRCLTELAHSLNVPFEFHAVGEQLEDLKPHMFNRRVGEALAVNSVNRLHRVQGNSLGNLLAMIRDQAPNIVTLVEQEASHNGPYFLGRFLEALHYYSAIFDSLDATFPPNSTQRAKVEQYIFAKEINNIVACEGADRTERHERLEKWRKIMEGKGFKGVPLSANAVTQSKILLGLYSCDAYRLTEDKGCLLLGWQDKPLIAASAWRC